VGQFLLSHFHPTSEMNSVRLVIEMVAVASKGGEYQKTLLHGLEYYV
jgi:hypothetical protein